MTVQNSLICRWLLALWQGFRQLWADSAMGGWCHRRAEELRAAGADSKVCDFLTRPGALRRGWEESRFQKLLSALLNLPVAVAKAVYRLGKGLWDGSLVFRFFTAYTPLNAIKFLRV